MNKALKYGLIAVGASGALYLGFISLLAFSPDISNYANAREFNSEEWKNWKESEMEVSLRWDMVESLTSEHKLVGMNVKQVKELLGKPDTESKTSLYYYLGMSGHGIDTGSLTLTILDGVVKEYKVWHG